MKKLIFILIILALPLLSAVSDEDVEYTFTNGAAVNLARPCWYNGSYCSTSAICNLTVYYPNNSIFIDNAKMQNNYSYHNYTFTTYTDGVYFTSMTCNDGGNSGSDTFFFRINSIGIEPSEEISQAVNRGIYFLFGLSALFFIGFLVMNKFIFKWTFFLFSLLFIVITVNLISISIHNEIGHTNIGVVFDKIAASSYYFYWFIGGLLLIMWVFTTLASLADRRRMKQAEAVGSPLDLE